MVDRILEVDQRVLGHAPTRVQSFASCPLSRRVRFAPRADIRPRPAFMSTRPSVMGPVRSSPPSDRHVASLSLLFVVGVLPLHHAIRGAAVFYPNLPLNQICKISEAMPMPNNTNRPRTWPHPSGSK